MLNSVGHAPKSHAPAEPIGIETEKQKIDRAENKAGNDEPLKLLPEKAEEPLAPAQLETLVAENKSTHKSNGLDSETANQMSQPPIGRIGRHPFGRRPPPGENAQRVIDHQKKDNQRPNDRNLVKKPLFHHAKVQKKSQTAGIPPLPYRD